MPSRLAELNEEHFGLTNEVRLDIVALIRFVEARDAGTSADGAKLFWELLRPKAFSSVVIPLTQYDADPTLLPNGLEDAVLKELSDIEKRMRIPYKPDSSESLDFSSAMDYVLVAGTMALRHQTRDGYSDDVRQVLENVRRIFHQAEMQSSLADAWDGTTTDIVSLCGVSALVMSSLHRAKYLVGEYEDALPPGGGRGRKIRGLLIRHCIWTTMADRDWQH